MENKMLKLMGLALSAGLMTGCITGSDDSSSGSTGSTSSFDAPEIQAARTPVAITTANAPEAAKSTVDAMDADELDPLDNLDLGTTTASSETKASENLVAWSHATLDGLADWAMMERVASAETQSEVQACTGGGSISVTMSEEGDSTQGYLVAVISFNSCIADTFNADGSLSVSSQWTSSSDKSEIVARNMKITPATGERITMNGGLTEQCSYTSDNDYCKATSAGLEINVGSEFFRVYSLNEEYWDYSYSSTSDWDNQINSSLSLDASHLDGSLNFSTPQTLSYKYSWDDFPSEGQMKMLGANDSSILLTFSRPGSSPVVQIDVDTNNDGVYECTQSGVTETQLSEGTWSCSTSTSTESSL
ncbi:hypothetical protein [Marinospirillum perlucidum]|uniref:hypothetical protein n=1 Tax=Marinospirillum perlucidum TaxID=1982602 RepID=UPI000DF18402|nr:hypothetical protein [Marinospirillum perlucidum]